MIRIKHKGNFDKTKRFFKHSKEIDLEKIIESYAYEGVVELSKATPIDSGATSNAWSYRIVRSRNSITIYWTNDNINSGIPVAILIQYGHATKNGGFVQGIDYINPAMKPVFNKIANKLWKEVTS